MQRKRLNNKMIIQQDGAPPHFSIEVRTWLNEKFNGRWIGRDGPISWAPCSPDLTPLDFFFFLWRYIKTKVYKTLVNDIANLKKELNKKLKLSKKKRKKTLENVFDDIVKRLRFCINVNGNTFEQRIYAETFSIK